MSWNLGNTTVRNPWRIREGLIVFSEEFNGDLYGAQQEAAFASRLADRDVIETNREDSINKSWHGRKWRSCFCKLGFATERKYLNELRTSITNLSGRSFELTPAGQLLIQAISRPAISEVFLRQLITLEAKSPVEENNHELKPFIFLLQFLSELDRLRMPGLSKPEIAAFVQTATAHSQLQERIERLVRYREIRNTQSTKANKKRVDRETLEAERNSIIHPKANSLVDYADTTVRYSRITGVISIDGSRIKIRDEKRDLIQQILSRPIEFLGNSHPVNYLLQFYSGASLPTDERNVLIQEVKRIEAVLQTRGIRPIVITRDINDASLTQIQIERHNLEGQLELIDEQMFARLHWTDNNQITEVATYLDAIENPRGNELIIDDKPAYLEWTIWRFLLLLNSLSVHPSETRRFELDADLKPTRHAPGGGPDMVMHYQDYLLVTEVTLLTSTRQEAAEGESVRRHVADIKETYPDKRVYGMFVAPDIQIITADTFLHGRWFDKEKSEIRLDIVPLNFRQIRSIINSMSTSRKTPFQLQDFLNNCLQSRDRLNAVTWLGDIESRLTSWLN